MDAELNKTFIKMIKSYFEDNDLENYSKVAKDRKYTKKYFDDVGSQFVPKKEEKKSMKKLEKVVETDGKKSVR